jgi:hypothetical protein
MQTQVRMKIFSNLFEFFDQPEIISKSNTNLISLFSAQGLAGWFPNRKTSN